MTECSGFWKESDCSSHSRKFLGSYPSLSPPRTIFPIILLYKILADKILFILSLRTDIIIPSLDIPVDIKKRMSSNLRLSGVGIGTAINKIALKDTVTQLRFVGSDITSVDRHCLVFTKPQFFSHLGDQSHVVRNQHDTTTEFIDSFSQSIDRFCSHKIKRMRKRGRQMEKVGCEYVPISK